MILLSLLCLVLTTLVIVELSVGFAGLAALKDYNGVPHHGTAVSVIVPACNEEDKIEAGLRSLVSQDYQQLEIIVVNDRSTDGTAESIDRVREEFPQIHRLDIEKLPEGWLGKPHALQRGAKVASGDYLLFTDADVMLEPTTISRALAAMKERRLDHLALVFKNITSGGLLNAIVADIGAGLMWILKPWKAQIADSRYFVGVGAFNMVRANVYREIGQHEQVRMQVIDDLFLGKLIKRGKYRQECLDGRGFVDVPWYCSVSELIEGLMKNVYAFFNYTLGYMAAGFLAISVIVVLPYWGVLFTDGATRICFICTLVARVVGIGIGLISSGVEKRASVWLLITPFFMLYIILKATTLALVRGGISWRGSFYPMRSLRKQEWVLSGLFKMQAGT
ncbi:MAG: glycosyltransferase [Desulfofustis sp.]|nr:glycosyltransferase [Desulfofustis sp.]MBT8355202.1 glycosyltransferase [Desulfofustis sp.]